VVLEGGKRGKRRAKIKTKTRESKAKLLPRSPKGARTGSKKANFTLWQKQVQKTAKVKSKNRGFINRNLFNSIINYEINYESS
jgi:hypothetical protein